LPRGVQQLTPSRSGERGVRAGTFFRTTGASDGPDRSIAIAAAASAAGIARASDALLTRRLSARVG
jgi:hypothetical protein